MNNCAGLGFFSSRNSQANKPNTNKTQSTQKATTETSNRKGKKALNLIFKMEGAF
jgi:hypothetical protein